ncbi:MAG: hypothetical protein EG824_13010 [Deltaproteobacteria bacterium]|nr:hypothetical protein [Deltaproteobacteria bacterium]
MVRGMTAWIAVLTLLAVFFAGCGDTANRLPATVSASFESGSIGKVARVSDMEWELTIADDNHDAALPASWRSWWYVRMDNPLPGVPTQITVKNSGWPYYYLPVYSYDRVTWRHFSEDEVTQNPDNEIVVRKRFALGTVWIARFYPYTFTDLERFIATLKDSPYVDIRIPGSSREGRPIYLLRITDSSVPVSAKKRIFLHARTHPAETPPSFLLEGMIRLLLSGTGEASDILARFEFYIFPMQNVDGVIAGNYRSTPTSENLEMLWVFDGSSPLELFGDIPPEVSILHRQAKELMTDGGPPVSIALNLHASNSEPDIRPFFYPHFGPAALGYSPVEASLWDLQLRFIDRVANRYGPDMIEPVPDEGGDSFAGKTYPESWWWANWRDQVMAMTLEMTYGRAGYAPGWIEPEDLRRLGASLALSIRDYFDDSVPQARAVRGQTGAFADRKLKYPGLYPPHAADELKQ